MVGLKPAVDHDQQGRAGFLRRSMARVARRVEVGVGRPAARRAESDRLGARDHVGRQAGPSGAADYAMFARADVEDDDRGQGVRGRRDHGGTIGVDPLDRTKAGEGQGDFTERSSRWVDEDEVVPAPAGVAGQDAAVVQHRIVGLVQLPEGASELGLPRRQRPRARPVQGV
jgi:hypothetical protein